MSNVVMMFVAGLLLGAGGVYVFLDWGKDNIIKQWRDLIQQQRKVTEDQNFIETLQKKVLEWQGRVDQNLNESKELVEQSRELKMLQAVAQARDEALIAAQRMAIETMKAYYIFATECGAHRSMEAEWDALSQEERNVYRIKASTRVMVW